MKIIDKFSSWIVNRALNTTNIAEWKAIGFGGQTAAGISITNDNALQISTVFACVRAISEDIAKLPLKVYKESESGKETQKDHNLNRILKLKPNPKMTSMSWRETLTSHVLGWGNGYSLINRNPMTGEVVELWPLRPDRVQIKSTPDGVIYYEVSNDAGQKSNYSSYYIFHVHGLGFDGFSGHNVIHFARESLGAAKAAERFGSKFFGNGANPGAVFEHPTQMSDKAYGRLKDSLATAFSGDNVHKSLITEEGMKFNKLSFAPDESQFLETRQFSVPEICRWFRMPPHKVADTTRAQGWSTIEQTNIDYVTDTLMPWMVRWEQAIGTQLLTDEEDTDGYFVKHSADALLRGDTTSRYAAYAIGRQWGWLSVNDIREKEDMNSIEDGDEYLIPLNMVAAGDNATSNQDSNSKESDNKDDSSEAVDDKSVLVDDAAARIANAEKREIGLHLEKKNFSVWLESFYVKHERYCIRVLRPLMKESDIFAMQLVSTNRFNAGDDFTVFSEQLEAKHKEFINANL